MSWQGYLDTSLLGTGMFVQAAIYDLKGNKLAASPGFELQDSEFSKIVHAYSDPENIYMSGLFVKGVKYLTIKADERSIYGKDGTDGVLIAKTKQSIMVATYMGHQNPSRCSEAIEKLADYLIGVGC